MENYFNVNEVRATACNAVKIHFLGENHLELSLAHFKNKSVPPMSGKDILLTLQRASRDSWSPSIWWALLTRKSPEQVILRKRVWHFSPSQPSLELDDEELLLELPLLRLGTDGATAIEVGGVIVRSAVGAPDKLPKAPNARASSNSANTANK